MEEEEIALSRGLRQGEVGHSHSGAFREREIQNAPFNCMAPVRSGRCTYQIEGSVDQRKLRMHRSKSFVLHDTPLRQMMEYIGESLGLATLSCGHEPVHHPPESGRESMIDIPFKFIANNSKDTRGWSRGRRKQPNNRRPGADITVQG